MRAMDIARLKALKELSARATIAAAAEALSLTPSAVSQQISHLEDEVGMPLTERSGRGGKLTYAGELLVAHAERILITLDEAKADMAAIRQEVAGHLRIAAFATVAAALLPPVLKALRAAYPRLQVAVLEMEPSEGLAALGTSEADVAIVDDLFVRLARMEKTVQRVGVMDDELYVVMASDHPLAPQPSIALSELKDEAWALDSATSFYGEFVVDLCRQAGFTPRVNAACRGSEIIAAMVEAGCSVSIIPGLRLNQMAQRLVAKPLHPPVKRRISVTFRQGEREHPAVKAFVSELLKGTSAS